MGVAYRLMRPVLTVRDIMDIKQNPKLRLTTSPFGISPAEYAVNPPIYIGAAAPWKGMKLSQIQKSYPNVAAGLARAIAISKQYANVKGTGIHNGKLYPRKCIEQMKHSGRA